VIDGEIALMELATLPPLPDLNATIGARIMIAPQNGLAAPRDTATGDVDVVS